MPVYFAIRGILPREEVFDLLDEDVAAHVADGFGENTAVAKMEHPAGGFLRGSRDHTALAQEGPPITSLR